MWVRCKKKDLAAADGSRGGTSELLFKAENRSPPFLRRRHLLFAITGIKAVRGAARLKKVWGKRRRTKRLTKVDNVIGISRPEHGLCSPVSKLLRSS